MRALLAALVALSAVALPGTAAAGIASLTDADFEERTRATSGGGNGPWFVLFYAPWCSHCKAMLEDFEETAGLLEGRVKVGKLNCDKNRKTKARFPVHVYPTLYLIEDGMAYLYEGRREARAMAWFAAKGYKDVDGDSIDHPDTNIVVQFARAVMRDFNYVGRQLVPRARRKRFEEMLWAVRSFEDIQALAEEDAYLMFLVVAGGVLLGISVVVVLLYFFSSPAPDPKLTRRVVDRAAQQQAAKEKKAN